VPCYTSVKVCITETTEYWICLAVGEFLFSQRDVWVPRSLIKDGWAVDYKDKYLDIDSSFVRRYRITDY
jgi:hypothetical protein